MGFLTDFGHKLVDQGYEIVPIMKSKKAPMIQGWQDIRQHMMMLISGLRMVMPMVVLVFYVATLWLLTSIAMIKKRIRNW